MAPTPQRSVGSRLQNDPGLMTSPQLQFHTFAGADKFSAPNDEGGGWRGGGLGGRENRSVSATPCRAERHNLQAKKWRRGEGN